MLIQNLLHPALCTLAMQTVLLQDLSAALSVLTATDLCHQRKRIGILSRYIAEEPSEPLVRAADSSSIYYTASAELSAAFTDGSDDFSAIKHVRHMAAQELPELSLTAADSSCKDYTAYGAVRAMLAHACQPPYQQQLCPLFFRGVVHP